MSETPFIPFYTSDFLAGTSGMTAATKGVYITLLCLMYEAEGPLPQQWDTLARRCGCTLPAFKKAIQALSDDGKVTEIDGGLWSHKCERHIAQRREKRKSATASANKRWEKIKQKQGIDDADAMPTQCYPEPELEEKEDTNVSSKKNASSKSKGTRLPDDWRLPKSWGEWAVKTEGLPEGDVRREADSFRDYWRGVSGSKGVKLDWQATWRNWVRKNREFARARAKPLAAGTPEIGEQRKLNDGRTLEYAGAVDGWMEVME